MSLSSQQHLNAAQDLALLLGPRQADIMRLLWSRGSATGREVHTWLVTDPPLAYTTVMTICVRLTEKGLLERRHVTPNDECSRQQKAYVYTPRLSEQEFARSAVGQRIGQLLTHYPAFVEAHVTGFPIARHLSGGSDRARVEHLLAYLGTLHDSSGQRTEDSALDTITALLERAEVAERAAATSAAELQRAQQNAQNTEWRAQSVEQRAQVSERRAATAEQRAALLQEKADNPPPPKRVVITAPAHEYRGKICRVCGRPAPPQSAARHDDLRVCTDADCRREARRRDNITKQHRYKQRRRAHSNQVETAISTWIETQTAL
jgi:predicted transcriptional regulator